MSIKKRKHTIKSDINKRNSIFLIELPEDYESKSKKIKLNNGKELLDELNHFRDINMMDDLIKYYSVLGKKDKKDIIKKIKDVKETKNSYNPIIVKILNMEISLIQKSNILKQYMTLISERLPDTKLSAWFNSLLLIPFGKYTGLDLKNINSGPEIKLFLDDLKNKMNKAVYGHEEAKHHIIQIIGHQIRNPKAKGNIFGICGAPGIGKTELIKEGIAKALGKPFVFISLGGAQDATFLEGFSFTYSGSSYGRIVNGLIDSKCMDPVIYFDELDKISDTQSGEEITNILIHLTDPTQNNHFRDKYFHGIDIDLSRATIIFSYNNSSHINPILLDRITTIEVKYLLVNQKKHIAKNYLLPAIITDLGLKKNDIIISDNIISKLINDYTKEGGVRKLKSLLYNICREINLKCLLGETKYNFPYILDIKKLDNILKNKNVIIPEKIHEQNSIGIINGLYATDMGTGGILPVQILWYPSIIPLDVKATGNLQQVIKESTTVAATLAFNYLMDNEKDNYLSKWKDRPQGIHIHFPDGSVSKDGPSAGTAITVAIYSLLQNIPIKNNIAITGEINLQGQVTAIGGLENKLEGAKKAGVKFVLYPYENEKDIAKIKERNPNLIDSNFKIQSIKTIKDALDLVLVK